MSKKKLLHVSEKAVIRRINRLLKSKVRLQGRVCQLLKTRPARSKGKRNQKSERQLALGTYYVVGALAADGATRREKTIVQKHVDLEKFARSLGALAPYETL